MRMVGREAPLTDADTPPLSFHRRRLRDVTSPVRNEGIPQLNARSRSRAMKTSSCAFRCARNAPIQRRRRRQRSGPLRPVSRRRRCLRRCQRCCQSERARSDAARRSSAPDARRTALPPQLSPEIVRYRGAGRCARAATSEPDGSTGPSRSRERRSIERSSCVTGARSKSDVVDERSDACVGKRRSSQLRRSEYELTDSQEIMILLSR